MSEIAIWRHARGTLVIDRPIVVGILNATPDSFSDGGQLLTVNHAVARACDMADAGADLLDIGGESTRPQGATVVAADEESDRVIPVIRAIRRALPDILISVDTTKSVVAARALDEGAAVVNDVSAMRFDEDMARVCGTANAGVVLMHSRGGVTDMATYANANYGSVVDDVIAELGERLALVQGAGITREHIVVDPGIGFSKRSEHSLALIAGLSRVAELGFPVMIGVSRKRFVGELTGESVPAARVIGTAAANVIALERGARIFRVHDVKPNRQALDVAWAIIRASRS